MFEKMKENMINKLVKKGEKIEDVMISIKPKF
jgi:hypothetical protein